jgi:hypothetical protein
MDHRESADVLKGFIDEYTAAWNTADLAAIVEAYATPCFVVKGGRVFRHRDQAANRRYFSELLASNQQEGQHTWSVGNLQMYPPGGDAVLITVRWLARRTDRSIVWDFLDSYLVAIDDGRWRILGDVVHS